MRIAATIRDVAEVAGVSPATVSRVLNGQTTVDPVLARRVRRATDELDYRPSRTARALRTRRSHVWNLLISDVCNAFFGEVTRGIEDVAQDMGYAVVLCNTDDQLAKELAYLELAVAERVAGLILSPAASAETSVELLRAAGIPVVLVDREIDEESADTVAIDNRAAARAAVRHLLGMGFRRIGCISGPPTITTARHRVEGYRAALADASVESADELIRYETFKMEGGGRGAAELLALEDPPDALFVSNAPQCVGALKVARERGLDVPNDLGILCFDDEPWAALTTPSISTVSQPSHAIGSEAARLLLRRINGDTSPARRLLLDAELRIRASSRGN